MIDAIIGKVSRDTLWSDSFMALFARHCYMKAKASAPIDCSISLSPPF